MSGDLHVDLSGEGDFHVETDCAWRVEIRTPGGYAVVVGLTEVRGGEVGVTVDGRKVWSEADGVPLVIA